MDVRYDTVVSPADRSEVEHWITANNSADIEYITIDENIVSVHGYVDAVSGVTGTTERRGDLATELTAARDGMRRLATGPHPID
jgi:hypothetical protein